LTRRLKTGYIGCTGGAASAALVKAKPESSPCAADTRVERKREFLQSRNSRLVNIFRSSGRFIVLALAAGFLDKLFEPVYIWILHLLR
jgi:hypothetical protein